MKKIFISTALLILISFGVRAQGGCDTILLADSIKLCLGTGANLNATHPGSTSLLSVRWSPGYGLSDTTILNPAVTTTTSGYYFLKVLGLVPGNLVANGDFSAGNTGFSSSYTYAGPPSSVLYEGYYSVYTNPNGVHSGFTSFGDHTTGTGNMMIINGGYSATDVWCQTISVTPNTDYDFSAWFANCSSGSTGAYAPILQFKINGSLIGSAVTVTATPGTWVNFHATWNSATSTTANICIYDALTTAGGNDFVIDDITFQKYCTTKDSVYVKVVNPDTFVTHTDTSLCSTVGSVTLTAPIGFASYLWSTGSTATTISVTAAGAYQVFCSNNNCHIITDSFNVNIIPFALTTSTIDTLHCFPDKITLVAKPGFTSYAWQDGSTGNYFDVTAPGTFYVTSASYCAENADTFHVIQTALSIDLGPDTTVCMNYPINVPVYGKGISYLWQDGSTSSTYSASHTGQYSVTVHQGGCTATDSVNVTFFHFSQNIPDTFICKGTPINYRVQCSVPNGGSVMWNDGVINPSRAFSDSGTWWVFVSKDECQILDTVRIETGHCNCWQNIPEAFTPNNDGLNDLFTPRIQPGCTISGYQLNIFNRWGELVFTSDFRDKGWDGTYKGQPADLDVYMYSLQFFVGEQMKAVVKNGTVTLVR